jgi:predicted Holliday junction resolvase-like endonuclease
MGEAGLKLLVTALAAVLAILLVAHYRLRLRLRDELERRLAHWRGRELEAARAELRRVAEAEAGASLARWRLAAEAGIRADAVRRSSAVVSGRASEHLAPYIGSFPYNPRDARFLGTPVDLLVFDGLSEERPLEVVFLETMRGGPAPTTRERRVRDAVVEGRVSWREFRVGDG